MRSVIGAAVAALTLLAAPAAFAQPAPSPAPDEADTMAPPRSQAPDDPAAGAQAAAPALAAWVIASGDNGGLPFVVIDKIAAEVSVFDASGAPLGEAPALLGFARGDDSAPGIGDRELSHIRPSERTTPAGRFLAGFGPADGGRTVLWVDYETAISLHPVVTSNPKEHRLARLQSPTAKDNRITFGCINVSTAFYREVVVPAFSGGHGVVYILPEAKPLAAVFPAFDLAQQAGGGGAQATAPSPLARLSGPDPLR